MPATLAAPHSAVVVDSVCDDCAGTCQVIDAAGSISGVVGSVLPCVCSRPCPSCHGTGQVFGLWAINVEQEIYEEGFRPCHCQGGHE